MKKKKTFLNYIKKLQKKYNLKCFCPSLNVSNKYCEIGIMTVSVQVGIPRIDNRILAFNPNNSEYYNKIITTCTSSNSKYINIKGIDKFYKLMKKTNNLNNCMILGFDGSYKGILCKKFNNSDFLNILSHSSFFIQLSRTECYSVTQIQAKQLKIPLIVSDVDGNVDTVPNIYNRVDKFNKLVKEFDDKCDLAKTAIDYNYYSSLKKENIANFDKNLKRKVGI